jgi:surfactin synthase thioesterase subunit
VPEAGLAAWAAQTDASFSVELVDDGHMFLTTKGKPLSASVIRAMRAP